MSGISIIAKISMSLSVYFLLREHTRQRENNLTFFKKSCSTKQFEPRSDATFCWA